MPVVYWENEPMKRTDLSLSLGVIHQPSKVTGWWVSCQEQACSWWAQNELPASRRSQRRTECVTGLHVSFRERQKRRKREGATVNRPTDNLALQLPHVNQYRLGFAVEMWPCAEEDVASGSRIMGITDIHMGDRQVRLLGPNSAKSSRVAKLYFPRDASHSWEKKLEY